MIELLTSYSFTQVPYIANEALDEYAEALVRDYSPERLITPGAFDILGFVRNYLGLNVKYYPLNYENMVIGVTAFHDDQIQIYDESTNAAFTIDVESGTVVIDISLQAKQNENRCRFTLAHEGSHWLIHRNTLCGDMVRRKNKYCLENQADFLAAAILIPRRALRVAYLDFFRRSSEKPRVLVRGKDQPDDILVKQLASYIADIFHVSNRAALIRLEKLNAVEYRGVRSYAVI
ncbi:MAG: ImmA/IrrE family metallo-endopeptidase [Oscillospiraceae bacterium]|nr:ImmA/IrrE family metallo-endopeptidase [Oscillospiraceae bacterium]